MYRLFTVSHGVSNMLLPNLDTLVFRLPRPPFHSHPITPVFAVSHCLAVVLQSLWALVNERWPGGRDERNEQMGGGGKRGSGARGSGDGAAGDDDSSVRD